MSPKKFYSAASWLVLACLVVPMFASYYFDDMFSSISYLFEHPALTQLGWDAAGYGLYASGYSVLCVFGGLVVCGVLLDKWGVRITGSIFVGMMAAGAGLVTWSLLSGVSWSLQAAYVGCMLFGLGSEIAGTAVTRSIAKWFRGGPMALAMGLQLAIARLGTAFALVLSPKLVVQQAGHVYTLSETARPSLVGMALMALGLILWALFVALDARSDHSAAAEASDGLSSRDFVNGRGPLAQGDSGRDNARGAYRPEASTVAEQDAGKGAFSVANNRADAPGNAIFPSASNSAPAETSSSAMTSAREETSSSASTLVPAETPSSASTLVPAETSSSAMTSSREETSSSASNDDEAFRMKDVIKVLGNRNFWLLALLCVLFYSSIIAFKKFAGAILIPRFDIPAQAAGWMVSMLPFSTVIFAPLFGMLVDKFGHGTRWMVLGSFLALIAHLLLAFAPAGVPFWGYLAMVFLGFGYSLVPAALWPSVPKIVPDKVLGTTFALIYWVQNLGLLSFKWLSGLILGSSENGPVSVELMFVGLCIAAVAVAFLFLRTSSTHPELALDAPNR